MRIIKILLALMAALMCLVYAGQNVANLEQAYGAFTYVLGNGEHVVYPKSFLPSITHPVLLWAALIIVVGLEFTAGGLLLVGTVTMWRARAQVPADVQAAKHSVYQGAGVAMLVWFGLFHVMGGAAFQMWQTQVGDGSLVGAFWYGSIPALTALFIAVIPDD
jgi:predicted small integral membrane protein